MLTRSDVIEVDDLDFAAIKDLPQLPHPQSVQKPRKRAIHLEPGTY
jgi:hypothetical protein